MAAVEAGDADPISEELKRDSSSGREEIAAFASSTQGLSALVSRCRSMQKLPAVLSDFLFAENLHSEARASRLLETLVETIRMLRAADVEVVALKGAALAFFHYEEPALRPMGDLDLLLQDPRDLERATAALAGAAWAALFDTPRHRVFARPDERVASPAAEDPDNPIRLEIHTSFRLPVLGRVYDASAALRSRAATRELGGVEIAIASGPSLVRHLLIHAAEDFAGHGIRGIQAYDFRLLARTSGKLNPEIALHERERDGAPVWFAASAIERLFPNTFEELFLKTLERGVSAPLHERALRLPPLRYTRPARGRTRTLLTLVDRPIPRARFLLRTLFPTLGEVRANIAPGCNGARACTSVAARLRPPAGRRRTLEPAMSRPPSGSVLRAALAGAFAMAALGTVEIWFTELLSWVFHRDAFAPLDGRFTVVLFLLYPLSGALAAGVLVSAARVLGPMPDRRAVGAAVVLAIHGAFRTPHLAGGALVLVGSLNALLFVAAVAVVASPGRGKALGVLTGSWTVALLLFAPVWVMTDLAPDTSRPARAVGFAAAAGAIVAVAFLRSRRGVGRNASAAVSAVAIVATLAAVSLVGPDPPRQVETTASTARARGPNVLLVTLDTVRADHLSLYGYPRDTTPHLRRFAEAATVYTRATAPSNMTLATHASLFTGLAASEHRAHYDAGRPAGRPLGTGMPTLAEIFVKRGYDVSSVAGNYGFLGKGFGLDRGFPWVDARPRRSSLGMISADSVRGAFRRLLCGVLRLWPETETRARAADEITDLAIVRIDRARALGRPYFLFVNYFDAHERVRVPPPWAGSFSAPPGRPTGALFDAFLREMNRTGRVALAARDREDLVARYDETLAYVDASLARLLAHAAEREGDEGTLIVVTSDHGEAWGEHGAIGHGSSAYQEQVWVPLVVKSPRQGAKSVVEAPVPVAGLFALVTGNADELRAEGPVVAESFPLAPTPDKPGSRGGRALFSGNDKLIRGSDGRVELYDTWQDPGESRDLAGSPPSAETLSGMNALLDRWIAAHPPVRSPETPESREDRARLRSLGYLR